MPIAQGYIGRSPGDSSVVIARQTFSPTGIQTDFTFASGYEVGYLDLYLNGARLIEGQDFTATDGSVVGLTTYAQNGDVLELVAYKAFNLSNVTGTTGDFSIPDKIVHTDDLDTAIRFPQNDTFTVETAGSERLRITSSGNVGIGTDNPTSILHLQGSAPRITFTDTAGTDDTGKIFSTGGALFLQHRDGAGHGEIIFRTENSSTAVERLRITADGKVRVPDSPNGRFTAGAGDDLQIYHDATHSYIKNDTGELKIMSDDLRLQNNVGNANYLRGTNGGAAILYYNNAEKFTTTSGGIEVTGGIYTPTGISTFSNVVVGGATTEMVITGDLRVTGIITTGTGTVTIDGPNNRIGIGTASPRTTLDLAEETGGIALPQGTTAQRPTGNNPYIRYNTTNTALEFYNGTDWVEIISDYFPSGSMITPD
jgi:hypothetical protein